MKEIIGHDLLVPNFVYDNYSKLRLPSIPLTTVPTLDGKMMLTGTVPKNGIQHIVITPEQPGRRIVITSPDGSMQAIEADSRNNDFGRSLFKTAIDSLTITIAEKCILEVDIDQDNIQYQHMFDSFVCLISTFALKKQLEMIKESNANLA